MAVHNLHREMPMKRLALFSFCLLLALLSRPAAGATFIDPDSMEPAKPALLVDLVDDVSDSGIADIEKSLGLDLKFNSLYSRSARLMRVDGLTKSDIERVMEVLSKDPRIEFAEPEQIYAATFNPNDPYYKVQWNFQQIQMPDAWEVTQGMGVTVAVIDTGVAYEDYQDKLGSYYQVEDLRGVEFAAGYDFVNDDEHANDDHCHGTHVAGTIAQATNNGVGVAGMAYRARIMPLKVLSAQGFGNTADIADAIRFAADRGAQVINMSLGGRFPSKIMREAVHYAHKKGVVVVAAAGNNGARKVSYPAAYPHVIAVSATRYDETLTWYSNYGKQIDLAAPGGDTRVDQNGDGYPDGVLQNTIAVQDPTTEGYFLFQGTSMAAPHVAGAAAMVMARGVTNPDKVEAILKGTARQQGSDEWDEKFGYGILDAAAAVSKASNAQTGWSLLLAVLGSAMLLWLPLGTKFKPLYLPGLLLGSTGLLFPFRGLLGPGEILGQALPTWPGEILGIEYLGNPLLLSILVPVVLAGLFHGHRRLRPFLAGLAVGYGAYLLGQAFLAYIEVAWVPNLWGTAFDRLWLAGNGFLAMGLGALILKDRRP